VIVERQISGATGQVWADGHLIGTVEQFKGAVTVKQYGRTFSMSRELRVSWRARLWWRVRHPSGSSRPAGPAQLAWRAQSEVRSGILEFSHADAADWSRLLLDAYGIRRPRPPWWARALAWLIAARIMVRR
jgi:hypothetical protein